MFRRRPRLPRGTASPEAPTYRDAKFALFREIIKFPCIFSLQFGTLSIIAYLYTKIGREDCNSHVALAPTRTTVCRIT